MSENKTVENKVEVKQYFNVPSEHKFVDDYVKDVLDAKNKVFTVKRDDLQQKEYFGSMELKDVYVHVPNQGSELFNTPRTAESLTTLTGYVCPKTKAIHFDTNTAYAVGKFMDNGAMVYLK